jgi:4-aminobutyrate aminotransferase-like enzyme
MSEPHPVLGTLISDPPHIERGWQNYLIGTDGRAYLDVVNNVTVVGHANVAVRKVRVFDCMRFNFGLDGSLVLHFSFAFAVASRVVVIRAK